MNPAFPMQTLEIGQAHVGLMNQGSRLERMVATLAGHIVPRKAAQFGVNDGRQFVECGLVSAAPGM